MKRREFIAGLGAAAWPLAARAQQAERVRRVGFLTYGAETEPISKLTTNLLREELQKLGWIEGRNLRLDFRFGNGDVSQTRVFAADLVQLAPDVIVTSYLVALRAVRQQTKTLPIVLTGTGDPVEVRIVRNQAHPEGNITGFANAFGSLGGKRLELLKEAAPNITRVGFMFSADNLGLPGVGYPQSIETAARSLSVQVVVMPVSDADGTQAAIKVFAGEPNGGVLASPGVDAIAPDKLIRLAAKYRLPSVSGSPSFVSNGGLLSYSADRGEIIRGAASYVDRLLRGAKVSDLPIQYPTKFHLAINLKTAKALGLTIPPSILAIADEVIE